MEHILKNGNKVIIRKPEIGDANAIIALISKCDTETKFLARNPNEFTVTTELEENFIRNVLNDDDMDWFVAEYEDKIVGQCSVGLVSKYERYRHRAEVTFVVLKDYWGLGIGRIFMHRCIDWCMAKNIVRIELDVVSDNERAIKMYESFGFKLIGTIPKAMCYPDGTYADKHLMLLEL